MRVIELYEEDAPEDAAADDSPAHFEYADTADVKASVFPILQQKIEKLNRRATKLGVPPITLTVTSEKQRPVKDYDGLNSNVTELYYEVKIAGQAPKLNGYKFMATIQHTENGNVIRTVPGEEGNEKIKDFYDAHPDYCDHCKKRRNRIDTFIVKDEKGNLRQIGRNCLADFFRTTNPNQILWYFSMLDHFRKAVSDADEETSRRGIRGKISIDVASILRIGAAMVRTFGYVPSKDKATGDYNTHSTAQDVRTALFPPRIDKYTSDHTKAVIELGKATSANSVDDAQVEQIMAWWKTIPEREKQNNEFMHNVEVLVSSANVSMQDIGYVVALFPMYYRTTAKAKEAGGVGQSNLHMGQVGQKLAPTKVKVAYTQLISGQYGTTQMVRMQDAAGNAYTWFNNSSNRMEDGAEYTIVGTVKKHDEYKGRNQTVLTRVKVQEPGQEQAPSATPAPKASGEAAVKAPSVKPQGDNKVSKAVEYIRNNPGITKAQFVKYAVDNLEMGINYATAMYYMPKIKAIRNGT